MQNPRVGLGHALGHDVVGKGLVIDSGEREEVRGGLRLALAPRCFSNKGGGVGLALGLGRRERWRWECFDCQTAECHPPVLKMASKPNPYPEVILNNPIKQISQTPLAQITTFIGAGRLWFADT